ncbi:hypothetical protein [Pseudomonas sp. JAI120]|uniref:hypothetical protein n=1 Tax=Pseudomonas sp. JAI120 TaxID=2723063 RepID=UPI0030EE12C9
MRWRTFPQVMGEQDVTLKFNMTALKGHRALHPAYVPCALLTLTHLVLIVGIPFQADTREVVEALTRSTLDEAVQRKLL